MTAAVAAALFAAYEAPRLAHAGPEGEKLVGGQATVIRPNAQTTLINQATPRAALDWNGFSINVGEAVIFRQPDVSSIALNRVVGPDASRIAGTLQANGQVFLINPSGILFAKGASVDVAGLVASTLNIGVNDFMSGRYVFSGVGGNVTVEKGASIKAGERRYVALLANQVGNGGTLTASNGTVALGAGSDMVLDFHGDGLLSLKVNAASAGAKIDHNGLIVADGGRVIMSAAARNALLDTVLNVDGIVQARGAVERNGSIYLGGGESGVTRVAGTLDVSNASGKGGEVRVLGEYVGLFDKAKIDASGTTGGGTVLVGGDFQGKNPDVQNASATFVSRDARLSADAGDSGDGGRIIVWSDGSTRAHGSFSARGGARSGNGGLVETSGHYLDIRGARVDTSAPKGAFGLWLLDPSNVTVVHDAAGTSDPGPFIAGVWAPAADDSNVADGDINNNLLATDVRITTASAGGQAGDITVNSDVVIFNGAAAGNPRTLTLEADATTGSISVMAGALIGTATGNVSPLNVAMTAGQSITMNGAVTTTAAAQAPAPPGASGDPGPNGGTVLLRAGTTISGSGSITTTGTPGQAGGDIVAAAGTGGQGGNGGEVFLFSTTAGAITFGGAINALGGQGGAGGNSASAVPAGVGGQGGNGGVVTIRTTNGAIVLDTISTAGGAAGATGTGTPPVSPPATQGVAGSIQLFSAGGTITQPSGTLTANNLKVISDSDVTLEAAGNDVAIVAANITAADKFFRYSNSNSFAVGQVSNGLGTLDGGNADLQTVTGITTAGDVTLSAAGSGDITVSNNIIKTGSADHTLTLQANGSIVFDTAAGVSVDTGGGASGKLNVVLNADRDADGVIGGAIQLSSGTNINSNGGTITLGGGATPETLPAIGTAAINTGISLSNAQLNSEGGAITLNGKGYATGSARGIEISNGSQITAAGGTIGITGTGDAGAGGDNYGVAIGSGPAPLISVTGSGSITIKGTGGSNGDDNHGVLIGSTTISAVDGAITIEGIAGSGNSQGIRLGANTNITSTGAATITLTGTGANGGAGIGGNIPSIGGNFSEGGINTIGGAAATGDIVLHSLGGSDISLGSAGAVMDVVTTGTGTISLTATGGGAISHANGSISGNAAVTLTADKMNLASGINAGGATVTLRPDTGGTKIDLGSAVDTTASTLELSSAELDQVTAGTLVVGRNDASAAGNVTVSQPIAPTGTTELALATGGTVTQSTGATLSVKGLGIAAAGAVTLNEANNVSTLSIFAGAAPVSFNSAIDLFIGNSALGAPIGIVTSGGDVTLTSAGALSINEAIDTSGGNVSGTSVGALEVNGGIFTGGALKSGNVALRSSNSTLTVNSPIDTVSTAALDAVDGGSVVLESKGALTIADSGCCILGSITTTGVNGGNGGEVFLRAETGDITVAGFIDGRGGDAGLTGNGGNGAVVTIQALDGKIDLIGGIDVSGGFEGPDVGSLQGNGGTIQLSTGKINAPSATIMQESALLASGNIRGSLVIVSAADNVTLTGGGCGCDDNDIGTIAANIVAPGAWFKFIGLDALTVDTVAPAGTLFAPSGAAAKPAAPTPGIRTRGGKVEVVNIDTFFTGAPLVVNAPIVTTPDPGSSTAGGTVLIEADGPLTITSTGGINTTGAANDTGSGPAGDGGEIFLLTNLLNDSYPITIGGPVVGKGGSAEGGSGTTGGNGAVITLLGGKLAINSGIDASGGAKGSGAVGNGGTIQLNAIDFASGDSITQDGAAAAAIVATGAVGGSLAVFALNGVALDNVNNDVAKVAASTGGFFKYANHGPLAIDTVAAAGTLVGSLSPFEANLGADTSGILTGGGPNGYVEVQSVLGPLNVNQPIIAVGGCSCTADGGYVVLKSGGGITIATGPDVDLIPGPDPMIDTSGRAGNDAFFLSPATAGGKAGDVFLYSTVGAITLAGAIKAEGGAGGQGAQGTESNPGGQGAMGGAGGVVTIRNDNGAVVLHDISTAGGAGGPGGPAGAGGPGPGPSGVAGSRGSIQLQAMGGGIMQAAGSALSGVNALKVISDFDVMLDRGSDALVVAAQIGGSNKSFTYIPGGPIAVGSIAGGLSTLDNDNANLAAVNGVSTSGGLTLTAAGTITQTAPIVAGGASSLTAGANAITLVDPDNDFQSPLSISNSGANDVAIRDANALVLGTVGVGRNLSVITAGTITQSGAATVPGTASFIAGPNAVTLTNTDNDFTGAVSVTNSAANAVSITDKNALTLGTLDIGQNLTVDAGGLITQTSALTVPGTATFLAHANPLTLTDPDNDFQGALSIVNSGAGNNVAVRDRNTLSFGDVTVGGNLTVTAASGINQAAPTTSIVVAGTSSFTTLDGQISLFNPDNDFGGPVSASNNSGFNIRLNDRNALTLGTVSAGGIIDVLAGSITQTGVVTAPGNGSQLDARDGIALTNPDNDFGTFLTISTTTGGVALRDKSALAINSLLIGDGGATVTAGTTLALPAVTTRGSQTYGAVTTTLNGNLLAQDPGNNIAVTGATSLPADRTITSTGGSIAFNGDIAGAGRALSVNAATTFSVTGATTVGSLTATAPTSIALGTLTTTNGVMLTSDGMALSTTDAPDQTVTLRNATGGRAILLGGDAATSLSLSAAELGGIGAQRLVIGRSDAGFASGPITIGGDVTINAGTLHLFTAGGVTGTAGGIVMPSGALAINAAAPVSITAATNNVGTLALNAAGFNVAFSNSGSLAIGTVDGVSGVSGLDVVLFSATGQIAGPATVTGRNVTLDSATGVGTGTAGRVSTNALTLAARSRASGGVFVNATNNAELDTIGAVSNTAAGPEGYDLVAGGSIAVRGPVSTANATSAAPGTNATSGGITLLANGDLSGSGTLTTGDATANGSSGTTTARSGSIRVTATGGTLLLGGDSVMTTGAATIVGGNANSTAISGDISLSGQQIGSSGDAQFIAFGTASGGATNTSGSLDAATTGTSTAENRGGGILVVSTTALPVRNLSTAEGNQQSIQLEARGGNLTLLSGGVDSGLAGSGNAYDGDELSLVAVGAGNSVTFARDLTAGRLRVTSDGAVSVNGNLATSPVNVTASAGTTFVSSGDIEITGASGVTGSGTLATGAITADAAGTDLDARVGSLIVDAGSGDVRLGLVRGGDATMTNPGAAADLIAGGASLRGRGIGTAATPQTVRLGTATGGPFADNNLDGFLSLTSTGAGAAGDIHAAGTGVLPFQASTASSSRQTVDVRTNGGALTWFGDAAGLSGDDVTFTTTGAGGTIAFPNVLVAANITLNASGGVDLTPFDATIGTGLLTNAVDTSGTPGAGATGGSIAITAAGTVTGSGQIQVGPTTASGGTANGGSVTINAQRIGSAAAPLNIEIHGADGGTTNVDGRFTATAADGIFVTSPSRFTTGALATTSSGAPINVATTNGELMRLGGNIGTNNGTVSIGAPRALLDTDVVVTSNGGSVTFAGTVESPGAQRGLTVTTTGTTTFGASIGALAERLSSLVIDGGGATALNGDVFTTGAQTYGGNLTLGGNTALTGGTPTFGGNVAGGGNDLTLNFSGTTSIDGARFSGIRDFRSGGVTNLTGAFDTSGTQRYDGNVVLTGAATLTGTTPTFGANVAGGGNDLTLNFSGPTNVDGARFSGIRDFRSGNGGLTNLTGSLTTSGTQRYDDDVVLTGATTLTGTTPTFGGTVAGGGNDLTLNFSGTTTIDGARFAGIRDFRSGGVTNLAGAFDTSGTQRYDGNVALTGAATLTGTTPTFGGNVAGGGNDLTLNFSGTTTIDGARFAGIRDFRSGGVTNLAGAFNTSGTQRYDGNVALTGATTLTGTTPTFGGNVAGGGNDLTLNFSGTTSIDGAAFSGIRNLTTGNGGTTSLTGALTTTASQTYNDDAILAGATVLNAGAGNVTFAGTLEAPATPRALTITAANTRFGGAVGGNLNPLSALTVTGAARIDGGAVTTTGTQTYNNAVVVGANTNLDSSAGNISFGGALDPDTANTRTLLLNAPTGTVTFSGSVGANATFADLDVISGPNTIVFNGGTPQTVNVGSGGDGTVSFGGNVRLDQSVAVNTTGNNVNFANGIETGGATNRALAINAGSGNVDLQTVGNATPLAMLTANGNVVSFNQNAVAQQVFVGANQVLTNGTATIVSPLAFAGFDGPAALTLTGPASGGTYGGEANMLRVDVPGLFVVTPNTNRVLFSTVWLQGDPAKKPFYQFYDDVSFREVVYNGRPVREQLNVIADPQQTREILRQVNRIDIEDAASLASAEAAGAARAPELCAAADAKSDAVLLCTPSANR